MTKLQDRKKKEKIKEERIKTKPYRYTSEGYLSMEIIAMVLKSKYGEMVGKEKKKSRIIVHGGRLAAKMKKYGERKPPCYSADTLDLA